MKTRFEYLILSVPFHADVVAHEVLAEKVNTHLKLGFELYGTPFASPEGLCQAMTRPILTDGL
jgi:hypothetical protein